MCIFPWMGEKRSYLLFGINMLELTAQLKVFKTNKTYKSSMYEAQHPLSAVPHNSIKDCYILLH